MAKKLTQEIDYGVYWLGLPIVNVYMVKGEGGWTLIDAGLTATGSRILKAAEERFETPPQAIILTHGHFDHVGALEALLQRWDVPVYAHPFELPYLTGKSDYPPPDPSVGGGMMAELSFLYPKGPLDLGNKVGPLPADGSVPGMPGWCWVATPGHSPGHVSLSKPETRTLLAGDAFVTTAQESAYAALAKPQEVHGPPAYFTPDWGAAEASVQKLAALKPMVAGTGHGKPMRGDALEKGLGALASNFKKRAVPRQGRYVNQPAVTDENGIVSLPPEGPSAVEMASNPLRLLGRKAAAAVRRVSDQE